MNSDVAKNKNSQIRMCAPENFLMNILECFT